MDDVWRHQFYCMLKRTVTCIVSFTGILTRGTDPDLFLNGIKKHNNDNKTISNLREE